MRRWEILNFLAGGLALAAVATPVSAGSATGPRGEPPKKRGAEMRRAKRKAAKLARRKNRRT